jgi:hypothetical protein
VGQLFADALVEAHVAEVSRYIVKALGKGLPDVFIQLGVFGKRLDRLFHLVAKLVVGQRRARGTHDGKSRRQAPVVRQPVKRRQQLALGQIAIGAENHYGARRDAPFEA